MINKSSAPILPKKPGRPKKKIINKNDTPTKGLLNIPNNNDNIMELIYNDPKIFKKIFSMLKGYFVDNLLISFKKEEIYITTKDHTKKTIIKIVINCNKAIEYYCKFNFEICVKREYLERIFATIDKNHSKIILFSKTISYQSSLEINLINEDATIHDSYIIDLSTFQKDLNENFDKIDYNKDDYLININIKSKVFKKFINDVSISGKLLTIEKIKDEDLKFKMSFNNKICFTRTIIDKSSYTINSSLGKDNFVNINLEVDYIKPVSNIIVSDIINIYVDTDKRAVFVSDIQDGMCTISVYNEIVNLVSVEKVS